MPVGLNENPVGFVDPAMPLDWSHPLNRGLVSRWKVIPNSGWRGGLTFRDLVRGGKKPNDGTLTNGPTWVGGGRRGGYGALSFDGSNDVVVAPGGLFSTNVLTISLWCRIVSTTTYQGIFSIGGGATNAMEIFVDNNTGSLFGGAFNTKAVSGSVVTGTWTHVVLTSSGSVVSMYINGKSGGTPGTADFSTFSPSTYIGARNTTDFPFSGLIDDVCAFNGRCMTPSEVSQLYQEQLRGSPETLRWVGARTYGFSEQTAATGGTPIFSSGILSSRIIGGGGIVA